MKILKSVLYILCLSISGLTYAQQSTQKVVLITGTASGFGKATATKLVQKGYIVYGGDIQVDNNQYLSEIGGHALHMDVTNDAMVEKGVKKIIDEQGRIDVLINNAGYGSYSTIENIDIDELKFQFDVNVFGYARLQKAVLPYMRKQRSGRIINVSSVVAHVSTPVLGWYAATKHAVDGMTDALRGEVKGFGIDVVKIKPGAVNTGFDEVAFAKLEKSSTDEDYQSLVDDFTLVMKDTYAKCEGPEGTADYIVKAVEARRPKANYKTTKDARQMIMAESLVSDQKFDKIFSKQLKKMARKIRKRETKKGFK